MKYNHYLTLPELLKLSPGTLRVLTVCKKTGPKMLLDAGGHLQGDLMIELIPEIFCI